MELTGAQLQEALHCDSPVYFKPTRHYRFARISLIRCAVPQELRHERTNMISSSPIIVEQNRQEVGRISTGFVPPAIVVAGAYRRDRALQAGNVRAFAWVERGLSQDLHADHKLSGSALLQKLQAALDLRLGIRASAQVNRPIIAEVYPVAQTLVYRHNAKPEI